MKLPPLGDVLEGFDKLDRWLLATLEVIRAEYPQEGALIAKLEAILQGKQGLLTALTEVSEVVDVLRAGEGPVGHDDSDNA